MLCYWYVRNETKARATIASVAASASSEACTEDVAGSSSATVYSEPVVLDTALPSSSSSLAPHLNPTHPPTDDIDTSTSLPGAASAPAPTKQRLAILLIIIDSLPHEAIWRHWVNTYDTQHTTSLPSHTHSLSPTLPIPTNPSCPVEIQFFIHAKHPDKVTSSWVRDRLVKTFQLKPQWGSLELTEVMIRLAQEALDTTPSFDLFIYASESCIPIQSLPNIYNTLQHTPSASSGSPTLSHPTLSYPFSHPSYTPMYHSWIDYKLKPNNGYAAQKQWEPLQVYFPSEVIVKADQWLMLSRAHIQAVLSLPDRLGIDYLGLFKKVR